VKVASELRECPQLQFGAVAQSKIDDGVKLISLGLGEPGFSTPPEIVEATVDALRKGYGRYCNCLGLSEIRKLMAYKLRDENGIDVSSENVVVTVGAKQAFLVALQSILRPGDEVVNITPCFLSFIPAIKIAEPDCILHNIDLSRTDFSFDMDNIRKAVNRRTKVIIINTPHNPTGTMLTERQAKALVAIMRDYPDCYILSDEIYEYLSWSGAKHISMGSFPEIKERVFTVNGMSKSFSMTGWRLGYLAVPPSCMATVSQIMQHSNMNVTTFVQKGACKAFEIDRQFLRDYCALLKISAEYIHKELKDTALRIIMPKGSLFCFVDISATGMTSDQFATELLRETNVALNPGILSGATWDTHVRISYAGDFEEIKKGIAGIKEFIKK
jgi:aspartate/methionine/tyrosine aminotransferase